jgi:hypothetical protein
MALDVAGANTLALLDRAALAADRTGAQLLVQPARQQVGAGGARNADAPSTLGGPRSAIRVGAEGLSLLQAPPDASNEGPESDAARRSSDASSPGGVEQEPASGEPGAGGEPETGADGLTDAERAQVRELQQRDAEVRRHEQAHQAAGGRYAGAATYEYTRGPDSRLYAVGGEVRIDAGAVPGDPEATIAKMRIVRRAALAPAEPSSQDLRVAAQAQQKLAQAQAELAQDRLEERRESAAAAAEERRSARNDDPEAALAAGRAFSQAAERQTQRAPEAVDLTA